MATMKYTLHSCLVALLRVQVHVGQQGGPGGCGGEPREQLDHQHEPGFLDKRVIEKSNRITDQREIENILLSESDYQLLRKHIHCHFSHSVESRN